MELLQIKNLNFSYPNTELKALDNINFSVKKGSINLITGPSGCGKTTLLHLIKKEIAPAGTLSGSIIFNPKDLSSNAFNIGFVGQDPDEQIVSDRVWSELAFGPENMGLKPDVIRIKTAEMASYFGIQEWYGKDTDELSGGQKQILNLASVMIMQPKLLILDEPTSQLDPIAAADFIATLKKLNREFAITVLIAEHSTEDIFPLVDKVAVMESGKIIFSGTAKEACIKLRKHRLYCGFPTAARIWNGLDIDCDCPTSVKEGKEFIETYFTPNHTAFSDNTSHTAAKPALNVKDIWYRYEKSSPDILTNASFSIYRGEIFSLLGANGSGKTTILNLLSGLEKPYRGKIYINGKNISQFKNNSLYRKCLSCLPQNPKHLFIKETVVKDYCELLSSIGFSKNEQEEKINEIAKKLEIKSLLDKHPYDLSGGERQKCALGKILLTEPSILLLDEPTKGMDAYYKKKFGQILRNLKADGKTILIVTHDIEFSAEFADRCAMLFNGEVLPPSAPESFFSNNYFYTTAASRISRDMFDGAVLCSDVINCCKGNNIK